MYTVIHGNIAAIHISEFIANPFKLNYQTEFRLEFFNASWQIEAVMTDKSVIMIQKIWSEANYESSHTTRKLEPSLHF